MDVKELSAQLSQKLAVFNQNLNQLIVFVGDKLKNFKNLSLGEQVAYPTIGAGLLLIMTSLVLFIII